MLEVFWGRYSVQERVKFPFSKTARTHLPPPPPPHLLLHLGNSKGGWHDQPVHAAPLAHAGTHARRRGRTTRTHAHRWHRVIRSARVCEPLTSCLGKFSLDDVYGHHIHQSDLHPIHNRREKCWSISYTLPIRFTTDQTDSVSLLLLLLLFLALVCYFGSAHSRKHTHTRAFATAAEYYTVSTSAHRGSMHSNEPLGSCANVPLVKCGAAQRDGGEASRSCLSADTLPLSSGRRLKVTMIAALAAGGA